MKKSFNKFFSVFNILVAINIIMVCTCIISAAMVHFSILKEGKFDLNKTISSYNQELASCQKMVISLNDQKLRDFSVDMYKSAKGNQIELFKLIISSSECVISLLLYAALFSICNIVLIVIRERNGIKGAGEMKS